MARLALSQVPGATPARFIVRSRDTEQSAPPAEVPSPYDWPVHGAGDEKLMTQLRWLLETFLSYPFEPYTIRAKQIEDALQAWGTAAFNALFNNLDAGPWFPRQTDEPLEILITCDEPELLAWPWEALHSEKLGYFGHRAQIQRRLSHDIPDPPRLTELPKERINILLVTARPYENDVDYRSISRPLVDLIRRERLPATVQVLRPPTFENLREHLQENPARYHILHFDGHGGYGTQAPHPSAGHFRGSEGRLLFEDEDGKPHEVTAEKLAAGLHGCSIPFVVLNACRSGQIDALAEKGRAFASVAGALVHAGFRAVLAMAYNLTVIGAQEFLPPFYRMLFQSGKLLEAAREGRLRMFDQDKRSSWNREATLPDWLLPVVYQQREDFDLTFAENAGPPSELIELPEEATTPETLTFVGRDAAIQALERALRRRPAGILIHGLGGIGKTSLAKHFLQWLRHTGGLIAPPFWFSFDDQHRASALFNVMGRAFFGPQFDGDQPTEIERLVKALREKPFVVVWDNFESARGFQTEHVTGLLTEADRHRLRDFLGALHGGKTKVLITSRCEEDWLQPNHCQRLPLGGLKGEELWEFAAEVLDELGIKVSREDAELHGLLQEFNGHPILIRAILAQIPTQSAAALRAQWQTILPDLLVKVDDPARARLLAALNMAIASFSEVEKGYLIPFALHERFVDLDLLHEMGANSARNYKPARMEAAIAQLRRAGLLTEFSENISALHPLLTSYLRTRLEPKDPERVAWERAFADSMGSLADAFAGRELHQQRVAFHFHGANFRLALNLAELLKLPEDIAALTQLFAAYARRTRNFDDAFALFERLADHHNRSNNKEGEAAALHELGIVAQDRWDFAEAEHWYFESLAISEKEGIEQGAARTYHQLGMIALEEQDFAEAESRYLKSLAILEKGGNESEAAISYHELGMVALYQGDFSRAERWYLKSLAIKEKNEDEHGAASTYHQLGIITQQKRDFIGAERWYLKALSIEKKLANERDASLTYHQLGRIAEEQLNLSEAEHWYLKSLAIKEKQGNERDAASTYNQLAEVAKARKDHRQAGIFFLKAFRAFVRTDEQHGAGVVLSNFTVLLRESPPEARALLVAQARHELGDEQMDGVERAVAEEESR